MAVAVREENKLEVPTNKQLYLIAVLLRENEELKPPRFPKTRQEASEVIGKLKAS